MKFLKFLSLSILCSFGLLQAEVEQQKLSNGLTILVSPNNSSQSVATCLYVNTGSIDEQSNEKGKAHLIEHMLFKGTDLMTESDLPVIFQKLSGYCNAATYYDWTRYIFKAPIHNWQQLIPLLADCFNNATFKTDLLNSELKAVVQELKMYKDSYSRVLFQRLMAAIFPDHPYHDPVIGYKQDLWNLNRDDLVTFYKKHYVPNNAVLVVVGNVDPQEVFDLAGEHFGSIPAQPNYKKSEHYINKDICAQTVTIYRDVQQPMVILAYAIPGLKEMPEYAVELLQHILFQGKSSRLRKKLVDDLQLVTDIEASSCNLFEHNIFLCVFEPKQLDDVNQIIEIINKEFKQISQQGVPAQELSKAIKGSKTSFYQLIENNEQQAYEIGQEFLAHKDPNYIFNYNQLDEEQLQQQIKDFCKNYLKPSVTHKGFLLPIPEEEKEYLLSLQERSDKEDQRILEGRVRESDVEPISFAKQVESKEPTFNAIPQPEAAVLDNGLNVLYHINKTLPTVSIILQLKADSNYDSQELPGLYQMLAAMLCEGTQNYTAQELADELESRAINLSISYGTIMMTMLKEDVAKALELLEEILSRATLPADAMEKAKARMLANYKNFQDDAQSQAGQKLYEILYPNHPNSKNLYGTPESIEAITQEDLQQFYKKYISPYQGCISIVGDIDETILDTLEETIGKWTGPEVEDIDYPELKPVEPAEYKQYMNRDQVVLYFAGLSIDRFDPDYDKLLIFDQIFGRGMSSRLFELREKTGAFYTINGSLISGCDYQPGNVYIKTIVSLDKLQEVQELLTKTINEVADTITQEEVDMAKNKILCTPAELYSTNSSMARTFLNLDTFQLPFDYYMYRKEDLAKITLEDVKEAAKKVLDINKMVIVKVGRV